MLTATPVSERSSNHALHAITHAWHARVSYEKSQLKILLTAPFEANGDVALSKVYHFYAFDRVAIFVLLMMSGNLDDKLNGLVAESGKGDAFQAYALATFVEIKAMPRSACTEVDVLA